MGKKTESDTTRLSLFSHVFMIAVHNATNLKTPGLLSQPGAGTSHGLPYTREPSHFGVPLV